MVFGDDPTPFFSGQPSFSPKSSWSPPEGHLNLEVFLSQTEQELLRIPDKSLAYSNLTKEDWQAIRSLADNRSIVIKKAGKGFCVAVWERDGYLSEAEKQLCDKAIYKDVSFNEKILGDLEASSNKIFKSLERKGAISGKEYNYKNVTNLGKLYFLLKIHVKLFNVPGHPVKSNCDTPTEKASEFVDHHLKPVMQGSWSYIKDSVDFLRKIKQIGNLPENSILVTADVVGLYPSIPHKLGLKALEEALKKESQSRSLLKILLSWLNLCSKIITLNLMEKLNNRVQERLSELSLHHHMRAFPWISLNLNF